MNVTLNVQSWVKQSKSVNIYFKGAFSCFPNHGKRDCLICLRVFWLFVGLAYKDNLKKALNGAPSLNYVACGKWPLCQPPLFTKP